MTSAQPTSDDSQRLIASYSATFMVELDINTNEVMLGDWIGGPTLAVSGIASASHNNKQALRFSLDDSMGAQHLGDARGESGRLIVRAGLNITVIRIVPLPSQVTLSADDFTAVENAIKASMRSSRSDFAVRVIEEL